MQTLADCSTEDLKDRMIRLENKIKQYPEKFGRTAPPWISDKLDAIYSELDKRSQEI